MRKDELILTALILAGCSAAGPTNTGGTSSANTQEHFETGKIRLECETMCSGRWGANLKEAAAFYELKSWKMLADKVMEIGYGSDLTYYYLAQSAEKLGYPDAAKTYYTLAAASTYKCDALFNNCNGLKPTQVSNAKLTTPNDIATVPTAPVAAKAAVVIQAAPAPVAPPAPAMNGISLPQKEAKVALEEFLDGAVRGGALSVNFCKASRVLATDLFAVRSYEILPAWDLKPRVVKGVPSASYKVRVNSSNRAGMPISKDWLFMMDAEMQQGESQWCLGWITG
ncbi:hypothetical protein [Pseudomonas sp. A-RE-19]|uniref:hypothetical protein n=1 Tax=Pseudomonas sp. A-RE-19 TaxID=2832401 RepID=UPI001CBD33D2|nr:hypothetical protein [Pseudomonas sp. A-RE-19]